MTNEEKFQLCWEQAQKVTSYYRDQCPQDVDPKASWVAVAVGVAGAGVTAYSAYSSNQSAERIAAEQMSALGQSNATNEAFLNEMLSPIDFGAIQSQTVNSNLNNFGSIASLGSKFSDFNLQDTLKNARAAGVDITAFNSILAQQALGNITGSYYNTDIGKQSLNNLLGASAPSMSVASNSLYQNPYAYGTGIGENRFLGNFLRDADSRQQYGNQQLSGLVDFGNSFASRLNNQTAALMERQLLTPDIAISSEAQRRSLGTQTGLAALSANAQAGGLIGQGLNNSRANAAAGYSAAGQQLGNAANAYSNYRASQNVSKANTAGSLS